MPEFTILSHFLSYLTRSTEAGPRGASPIATLIRGMGQSETAIHPTGGFRAAVSYM